VKTLLLLGALLAPFQCASDPDPDRRLEDTPSEALYDLAQHFGETGDEAARRTTLRRIIERYPGSSEAQRARVDLGEDTEDDG